MAVFKGPQSPFLTVGCLTPGGMSSSVPIPHPTPIAWLQRKTQRLGESMPGHQMDHL